MNRIGVIIIALCTILAGGCTMEKETDKATQKEVILQGHRGCRGEMPENTIEAFIRATDAGVSTLELDVVLSADKDLIVSHEPWMNMQIAAHPDGQRIEKKEQFGLNFYQMSTDSIQQFKCGTFRHPGYPDQAQVETFKPTLTQVVAAVREHCKGKNIPVPNFNIEIKSTRAWEGNFHPTPEAFAKLFLRRFLPLTIAHFSTIQSFDHRLLNQMHKAYPELRLVFLSENPNPLTDQMAKLEFKPYGVSLRSNLWTAETIKLDCVQGLHHSAWTVNEDAEMYRLIALGVKDIITDYPTKMIASLNDKGIQVAIRSQED